MNVTVSLTTVAIVFIGVCLIFGPPQSRWVFLLALIAAAGLGWFATLASGVATGIDTIDTIVNTARVG